MQSVMPKAMQHVVPIGVSELVAAAGDHMPGSSLCLPLLYLPSCLLLLHLPHVSYAGPAAAASR